LTHIGTDNGVHLNVPEIDQIVEFTWKGIKHDLSRAYQNPTTEIKLLKQMPELLISALYLGFDPNEEENKEVRGVHNFVNLASEDQELWQIWLKVKETLDKSFFYDHGIIKEEK
jgi:Large polyvalent protein-associated domain 3